MNNPAEPPAAVQEAQAVSALMAEARAVDAVLIADLGKAAVGVKRRGELLLAAKEKAGHGNWQATLEKHWPSLNLRTAERWMAQAKNDIVSDLKGVSHAEEADDPDAMCDGCKSLVNVGRPAITGCPDCENLRAGLPLAGTGSLRKGKKPKAGKAPDKPKQGSLELDPKSTVRALLEQCMETAKQLNEQCCYVASEEFGGEELKRIARLAKREFVEAEGKPQWPLLDWIENTLRNVHGGL